MWNINQDKKYFLLPLIIVLHFMVIPPKAICGDETGNQFRVYAKTHEATIPNLSSNQYGYNPDTYADGAGFSLIGQGTSTAIFNFPSPVSSFFIHTPVGNNAKIDAIEFIHSDGTTVGFVGYNANGIFASTAISSGNALGHEFVQGQPDNLYSLLGGLHAYANPGYYEAGAYDGNTPIPFSSVIVYVASTTYEDALFWSEWDTPINPISSADHATLTQIVTNILDGFNAENKNLVLPAYQNNVINKISADLDLIFNESTTQFTVNSSEIWGELPYAVYKLNSFSYSVKIGDSWSSGAGNHNSAIIFKKINGEWKLFHDRASPYMTTLNSLSKVGKYSFWIHDINGDNVINLTDAILGLQVLTGTSPDTVTEGADIDGNGTLGLEDIIIALKMMAE